MTGFQGELRERILAVASHMEVVGRGDGIDDWESVAADYLVAPEVVAAAPNIQGQGLLSVGDLVQGALVRGVCLTPRSRSVKFPTGWFPVTGTLCKTESMA